MLKIKTTNKKGQEEIVGFGVIVVIVAVIILFFFAFFLSSDRQVESSYEAASFLKSMLAFTTSCELQSAPASISDLVVACYREERCTGETREYSCDVLNSTLIPLLEESWPVGENRPVLGYKLEATSAESVILTINVGNATNTYKGAQQPLPVAEGIRVAFTAYYSGGS